MRRIAVGLDVLAVLVFVTVGRASHHYGETVPGVASATWPFLLAAAAGWALTRRADPLAPRTGIVQAVTTVTAGMALRVAAGQGTAPSFVAVSLGFLGLCMVGGRWLARAGIRRIRPSAGRR